MLMRFDRIGTPSQKLYKIDNIIEISRTPNVTAEIGGYVLTDHKLRFHNVSQAYKEHNSGRLCININSIKGVQWHMHPVQTGWWPSGEDIANSRNTGSVLVSRYGIWLYKRNTHAFIKRVVHTKTEELQTDLVKILQIGQQDAVEDFTTFKDLGSRVIFKYMKDIKKYGVEVFFLWDFQIESMQDMILTYLKNVTIK